VSDETVREPITGEGYAVASLDGLGEGWGFRKIRAGLDLKEFGANAIVLPPRYEAGPHFHDEQEELYFVHQGLIELLFHESEPRRLGPGGLARVDATTVRRLRNIGDEDAIVVVVGGKGGYVGRDGRMPEGEPRAGGPITD
jgi:mannose-6-phosphate isomerase-like protein (cupin superfamily)